MPASAEPRPVNFSLCPHRVGAPCITIMIGGDADPPKGKRPPHDEARTVAVIEEQLAITWFTQRGETEFSRTGYIDGEVTLEEAELNDWQTPERRDFPDETMKLYFVIRDGRGGIDWLEREVRFVSEEEERASQE